VSLSAFHPIVSRWFSETLGAPTRAQARGWAAVRAGTHTVIAAPTGSGKTLADHRIPQLRDRLHGSSAHRDQRGDPARGRRGAALDELGAGRARPARDRRADLKLRYVAAAMASRSAAATTRGCP
jgi:hypothetical protein